MSIPQAFIQELIARADVVEIVGRYVQLKKAGANFMGLCPFHGEKSPSFSVSPTKQFYHCFGCGAHGTAIDFVMQVEGLDFGQALDRLAEITGLPQPRRSAGARRHTTSRTTAIVPAVSSVSASSAAKPEAARSAAAGPGLIGVRVTAARTATSARRASR